MLFFFYFESIKLSLVLFISFFILLYFVFLSKCSLHPLTAGWLYLLMKWKLSISWFKNVEFRPNHHLLGLFIVSLLTWTKHLFHISLFVDQGEYIGWNNFLDVFLHLYELGLPFRGKWNV